MGDAAPPSCPSAERRTGRPPLSERRRAALQLEIAREAVRLFTAKGVAATTGEEIAQAAGVSVRTLWRHFATKESCVRPLLTAGLDVMTEKLRRWPPGTGLLDFLDEAGRCGELASADTAVLDLVRMTRTAPALRAVWLQVHDDALPVLAELLARRAGTGPQDLRVKVHAATLNGALRAAVEDCALRPGGPGAPDGTLAARLHAALRAAADGLPY